MPVPNIIVGQHVEEAKLQRAREVRREMTPEEGLLWGRLRGKRLGGFHFRRQQPIDGFIVDFYCHQAGLIVEVDGSSHDNREDADAERDRHLCGRGFRVIRVRNEDVRSALEAVLGTIVTACRGK